MKPFKPVPEWDEWKEKNNFRPNQYLYKSTGNAEIDDSIQEIIDELKIESEFIPEYIMKGVEIIIEELIDHIRNALEGLGAEE